MTPCLGAPSALPDDVRRHLVRATRATEWIRTGRHAAAERLLREVAAALVRRRAFGHAALTVVVLGQQLLERGRASEAATLFGEATHLAEGASDPGAAAAARVWRAAALTDAGQFSAAEAVCRAVIASGSLPPGESARALATLARAHLWQGRVDDAWTAVEAIDSTCDERPAFAEATVIRVLLRRGDVFTAGVRARALLAGVSTATDPVARLIATTAHLRVLAECGDLVLGETTLHEIERLARDARFPLRGARARVIWGTALRRAGRSLEARRLLGRAERLCRRVPMLFERGADGALTGGGGERELASQTALALTSRLAVSLLDAARREPDDGRAVERVLDLVGQASGVGRVELWPPGHDGVVPSSTGRTAAGIGPRVLERGGCVGPEITEDREELGVPVRDGDAIVGVLVVRTRRGHALPIVEHLELAAAVLGPRVGAIRAARETTCGLDAIMPELVGASQAIADLRRAIARAAMAPFAVLIEGESGVGKELVARALHRLSARRDGPFRDLNCAALPEDLLDSELFGHAKGAFTGALAERPGLVEEADRGTLFLDEVADLSARAQAKLLRVLQEREVRRVGEGRGRPVDLRVVSAANRDMRTRADEGLFRSDLLYRLDVIRLRISPLRSRPDDVGPLARHFWRETSARMGSTAVLTPAVLSALAQYAWPGNVRELQNVMAALAVSAPSRGDLRLWHLPPGITGPPAVDPVSLARARAEFERRFVESALARAGGARTRAARALGLSRQGLAKLLARHRIPLADE